MLRKHVLTILIFIVLIIVVVNWMNSRGFNDTAMAGIPTYSNVDEQSLLTNVNFKFQQESTYLQYLDDLQKKGITDTSGVRIAIAGNQYSAISASGAHIERDLGDRKGDVLVLNEENSWVEYAVEIPSEGFYQMGISYYALEGKSGAIQRSVQVDGEYPFAQAKRQTFSRMWRESGPTTRDDMGNEMNPGHDEVFGWQYSEFRDPEAKVEEPLRFYLKPGKHTIRINFLREPAAIGELNVFSPVVLPDYTQVSGEYGSKGYPVTKGFYQEFQAEEAVLKSGPSMRRLENRDPATQPYDRDAIALNTIGGDPWRDGGQWLEWEIEVPESGLYNIGTRFLAKWLNHVAVQRMVYIDGRIPFKEMNKASFAYSLTWKVGGLGNTENPYLFYLEKGKHRIRMEVQVGDLGKVFEGVQVATGKMSLLAREVLMITGSNPDPNYQWELVENIPNIVPRLHLIARDLDTAIKRMYALGIEKGSSEVAILAAARDQMIDMAAKPDSIPKRLDNLSSTQSSLGSWITGFSRHRLQLDYLIIKSPEQSWPDASSGFAKKLSANVYDFFSSFTRDYRAIGKTEQDDERTLDVWVARGRDWVQVLKQMIDNDFTANTGIKVNVNLIPANAMNLFMLAISSGNAPDVALGVDQQVPIDFALRGGLQDLGIFPDYAEVASRFKQGALTPYRFDGGNYALPETQNFNMMFYRKDVLQEIGIDELPETWQEVFDIIPILQQKGLDFYFTPDLSTFSSFLFQLSGEFYRDHGKASNLDTPEGLKAMKMWTGLYTNYKISKEANFYNRFRTGEIPIGVADYTMYLQLMTAAPELTGLWEMRPMPGITQEDGQINRSMGGAGQSAVIFKDSKLKDEAWEFVKWWTSQQSQERYGADIEMSLGSAARWNTANVEALKDLPWAKKDVDAILEQWEWFKEREIVPGDYYTTRYITNIWSEIVLNGKNIREALEEGVKEINKEIRKKRTEFNLDVEPAANSSSKGGSGK
ncbi:extracellular solute-binding protein [Paenibacillus mendelii]|uniref:Extracellular solute-binding protein n=1 Tax=Paenibacillus mendelii TaxID=206163 RepID=A0ABV6JAT2_9BACL|nr:extracellular solute-binding protein [Paenibacillus mendelii]